LQGKWTLYLDSGWNSDLKVHLFFGYLNTPLVRKITQKILFYTDIRKMFAILGQNLLIFGSIRLYRNKSLLLVCIALKNQFTIEL